jgi:hypothetical protein
MAEYNGTCRKSGNVGFDEECCEILGSILFTLFCVKEINR